MKYVNLIAKLGAKVISIIAGILVFPALILFVYFTIQAIGDHMVEGAEDRIRAELIANETLCEYNGDENGRNERSGLGSLQFPTN